MKYILLVSQGTMAKGVFDAAKILVPCTGRMSYACLSENSNMQEFNFKLAKRINKIIVEDELLNFDNVIIMCDIIGSRPCNSVLAKLAGTKILGKTFLIGGMNLPLVVSVMKKKEKLNMDSIKMLLNQAKDSIEVLDYSVQ